MLFSVEQAFVGREEIRAPLKTPAWEGNWKGDKSFILKVNLYSTVFIKIAEITGQSMNYPKTIKQGV